jgi:hypothetical protein
MWNDILDEVVIPMVAFFLALIAFGCLVYGIVYMMDASIEQTPGF